MAQRTLRVCGDCIRNTGLREFIADNRSTARCSFCGLRGSAPLDNLVEFMCERIHEDYEDAAGALPYETAEGGYQGAPTYTSWELLTEEIDLDLAPERFNEILMAIHRRMPDNTWCDRDPFSLSRFEVLHYSWEAFCHTVRRTTRYFFLSAEPATDEPVRNEKLAPAAMLREVAELAEERGLIRTVEQGLVLYRARRQGRGRHLRTAIDLGPPLAHQAVRANRMNPPGIPMFYGSCDAGTALGETRDKRGTYVVGRFITRKPLRLLDLAGLPKAADYFERDTSYHQEANFLRGFSREVAKRVERDDKNHIEYVPTQVVAEYFRVVHHGNRGPVAGIMWPSMVDSRKWSCALFASQADLVLEPQLASELSAEERDLRGANTGWLELTGWNAHRV